MKKMVAVVSSEKELKEVVKYAEKNLGKQDKMVVFCHWFFPGAEPEAENIKIIIPDRISDGLLSEKNVIEIEEKAAFFTRNWYRFDSDFEKEITFGKVNLGFAYENNVFYFFKRTLMLLKALPLLVERERPALLLANKNSISGEAAKAFTRAKKFTGLKLLNLAYDIGFERFPNLKGRKLREMKIKIPQAAREKNVTKAVKNGKTIFIRSRGYIDSLERELRQEAGINVVSLDNFLINKFGNPLNILKYLATRAKYWIFFKRRFSRLFSRPAFKQKFVFNGINFSDLFEVWTLRTSERDFPEFVFLVEELSKFFDSEKPKLLVEWVDAVPFERICTVLAKQKNVKSLVFQHGVSKATTTKGDWIRGFAPLTADKIAAHGDAFKESLITHKVPSEKITVVGIPRNDSLYERKFNDVAIRKKLGLSKNEKLVLFTPSFHKLDAKEIASVVSDIPNTKLVIKAHPADIDADNYRKVVGKNAVVVQHEDIHGLLHAADFVISQGSTVGLEAIAFGKPVIIYGKNQPLNSIFHPNKPTTKKAFLRATDPRSLSRVLKQIKNTKFKKLLIEREKKFYSQHGYKMDGKATERGIALIKSML